MEFECAEYEFNGVEFEIRDADDYVETVEQSIRTIKETIRSLVQKLSFKRITKFITKRLVLVVIRNINLFLVENSISDEYTRAYLLNFGTHTEVFEDSRLQHNSNKSRSTLAIALDLSPYRKPRQIFISLVTRKRL